MAQLSPLSVTLPENGILCPSRVVDGELKNWGEWSSCPKCGSAQRNRTRECMEPAYGGKPCPVTSIETEACDLEEW